jgi:hypothetical protein
VEWVNKVDAMIFRQRLSTRATAFFVPAASRIDISRPYATARQITMMRACVIAGIVQAHCAYTGSRPYPPRVMETKTTDWR